MDFPSPIPPLPKEERQEVNRMVEKLVEEVEDEEGAVRDRVVGAEE